VDCSDGFGFIRAEQWYVDSIYPLNGPVYGSTNVTVVGRHFEDGNMYCRFGTLTPTPVTVYDSSTRVQCSSDVHVAGVVHLEVTLNNLDYTDSRVEFAYQGMSCWGCMFPLACGLMCAVSSQRNGDQFTACDWSSRRRYVEMLSFCRA
jgi:hypothetical protein